MFKYLSFSLVALLALMLSTLSSVANAEQQNNTPLKQSLNRVSLYQELGEHAGLEKIVNALIQHIVKDKQIFPYFAKASVSYFKKGFIMHLCDIADGPCEYKGDSMEDIHTGMKINEADFNRVVELLVLAMEDVGITYPVQNKLLAKLAPMRGSVIKK